MSMSMQRITVGLIRTISLSHYINEWRPLLFCGFLLLSYTVNMVAFSQSSGSAGYSDEWTGALVLCKLS